MATPPDFTAGQVLTAAQMNAVGLWLIKSASFTTASAVNVDDVFSADFQDYRLVIRYITSTTGDLTYVNRVAGVNATTNYNFQETIGSASTVSTARSTAQSSFRLASATNGTFYAAAECVISGPAEAEATTFQSSVIRSSGAYNVPVTQWYFGNHSTATAYDGFQLAAASGTTTGTYAVYGMRR